MEAEHAMSKQPTRAVRKTGGKIAPGEGGRRPVQTLAEVDLTKRLAPAAYARQLAALQLKLQRIQQAYLFSGNLAVIVFEGWDAAGKGGTIRLMSSVLDPRGFKVWPIGAPRTYHQQRHYLLRFWERLPPRGAISVFDRSWYGRVLVERVEGLASAAEWKRAYTEINDYERLLTDDELRVVKLFFHISPDEQLRRFEARLRNPLKRWKLSYEDFRNRGRWRDYEVATDEMLAKTDTERAPWHVIAANNKKWARVEALRIITDRLAEGVDLRPRPLDPQVAEAASSLFETYKDMIKGTAGRAY